MSSWSSLRVVTKSIALMARAPGWLLQWNINRRRAKNTFERELLAAGLSPLEAKELGELYPFSMEDLLESARSVG
jgi:hypothetical protein